MCLEPLDPPTWCFLFLFSITDKKLTRFLPYVETLDINMDLTISSYNFIQLLGSWSKPSDIMAQKIRGPAVEATETWKYHIRLSRILHENGGLKASTICIKPAKKNSCRLKNYHGSSKIMFPNNQKPWLFQQLAHNRRKTKNTGCKKNMDVKNCILTKKMWVLNSNRTSNQPLPAPDVAGWPGSWVPHPARTSGRTTWPTLRPRRYPNLVRWNFCRKKSPGKPGEKEMDLKNESFVF